MAAGANSTAQAGRKRPAICNNMRVQTWTTKRGGKAVMTAHDDNVMRVTFRKGRAAK
ncbi:hypothetical protein [Rhodobium gokarnense]|uniref:50S ribosomal protein L28 n=1 Tax=Rhodobium gokarnense TaxID=364296 RepID=A0ABT3HH57_9HYPH|nr:hypothetical protein [Rhodobium gokarnense]MCW2309738.1 hypothetical protein [Rhodobium gokarnense]